MGVVHARDYTRPDTRSALQAMLTLCTLPPAGLERAPTEMLKTHPWVLGVMPV
jgi:hypothetical protein